MFQDAKCLFDDIWKISAKYRRTHGHVLSKAKNKEQKLLEKDLPILFFSYDTFGISERFTGPVLLTS